MEFSTKEARNVVNLRRHPLESEVEFVQYLKKIAFQKFLVRFSTMQQV